MPTHRVVRVGGKKKKLPVAYFWKDVIGTGKYRHPITGQTFEVDEKRIDGWIKKYEKMRERGIEIPTPVDHSDRAEDNRGFVVGARRVGGKLQLLHQVIGEDGARMACRNRCSVFIDPEFTDEHGKNWGEVIAHSAFTPKPVISGQGEFVPFAASRAIGSGKPRKVPVFYLSRQETKMAARAPGKRRGKKGNTASKLSPKKLAKVRRILGIEPDEEISDEELLRRLASHSTKAAKKIAGDDDEDDDLEEDDEEEDTDVDDELEEDDEDDDAEEEDEDEEEDTDAEDELEDSEEDDDEDEDEKPVKKGKKARRAENRRRVLAQRANKRRRELAGSVSLSRVPKDTDPTTLTLLRRSFKTERQKAIAKGAITPEVDEALCSLLFKGKQFNGLALSRMPGSEDPLAFRLYAILRKNKPVPLNGGRTGNQEAIALGRKTPGKGDGALSQKEREAIQAEVRAHMGVQQGKRRKDKDAD